MLHSQNLHRQPTQEETKKKEEEEEEERKRMLIFCAQARAQFKERSAAKNVNILIPVPPDADSPKFRVHPPHIFPPPPKATKTNDILVMRASRITIILLLLLFAAEDKFWRICEGMHLHIVAFFLGGKKNLNNGTIYYAQSWHEVFDLFLCVFQYVPEKDVICWNIPTFQGGKELLLRAHVSLPSTSSGDPPP